MRTTEEVNEMIKDFISCSTYFHKLDKALQKKLTNAIKRASADIFELDPFCVALSDSNTAGYNEDEDLSKYYALIYLTYRPDSLFSVALSIYPTGKTEAVYIVGAPALSAERADQIEDRIIEFYTEEQLAFTFSEYVNPTPETLKKMVYLEPLFFMGVYEALGVEPNLEMENAHFITANVARYYEGLKDETIH